MVNSSMPADMYFGTSSVFLSLEYSVKAVWFSDFLYWTNIVVWRQCLVDILVFFFISSDDNKSYLIFPWPRVWKKRLIERLKMHKKECEKWNIDNWAVFEPQNTLFGMDKQTFFLSVIIFEARANFQNTLPFWSLARAQNRKSIDYYSIQAAR